jgi:hypothetical protein
MAVGDVNERLMLAVSTIVFGHLLRRLGLVDIDVGRSLLKMLFNATLPSVLLMTFASISLDAQSAAVSICALGQALVLFLVHLAFRGQGRQPKELALLAGSCVGVNLGTFCYPLVEAVWGLEGLSRVVLFDAVNQWSLLIVAPLIYASSIAGASFSPVKALANIRKQLLSPCLVAMLLAVALRLMGWTLSEPVTALTASLAAANKPLALIALGILFDPKLRDGQLRDIGTLLALRYGASLLLGAFILSTLASSMGAATTAVVLAALVSPVPLLTVTYAMEYDCDIGLGASAVNAGNFCSFALLLAIANVDFSNATALVPVVTATGLLLTLFGVLGAKHGGSRVGSDNNKRTQAKAASSNLNFQRWRQRQRRSCVRDYTFIEVCGIGEAGKRSGGGGVLPRRCMVNMRANVSAARLATSRVGTRCMISKCYSSGRADVIPSCFSSARIFG